MYICKDKIVPKQDNYNSISLNVPTKQFKVGVHHIGKLELVVLAPMTVEKSLVKYHLISICCFPTPYPAPC